MSESDELTGLLSWLTSNIKASLFLEFNPHKNLYQTVEDYLEDFDDDEIVNRPLILSRDSFWVVNVYPNTPIGASQVAAPELLVALRAMRGLLEQEGAGDE